MGESSPELEQEPRLNLTDRGTPPFWESERGVLVSLGVLAAVIVAFLLAGLGSMGLWEPWEASDVLVASEYFEREAWDSSVVTQNPEAPGYNWAVPTRDGVPVATSLLKVWLVGAMLPEGGQNIADVLGALERGARLPIALLVSLLAFGVFAWVRKRFDTLSGLLASVALVTMPVIYFGAHNVSTQLLGVVTSAFALLSFAELMASREQDKRAWLWGVLFGASLAATFLDQRIPGVLMVLWVVVALGATQIAYAPGDSDWAPSTKELCIGLAIAASPLLYVAYVWAAASGDDAAREALSRPHVLQLLYLGFFVCALCGGAFVTRRTGALRSLRSAQGLTGLAIAALVMIAVLMAYAEVNPTLLEGGVVYGKIPALTFALEQEVASTSLASKHVHFDLWLRQIGFSTFPWIALIPGALAYLSRVGGMEADDEVAEERALAARMLVVWAMLALGVVVVASAYGHYFFTGYVPLAIGVGVMLGDVTFWRMIARHRPIILQVFGFIAVALILTIGKDLERYPHRFVELYAALPQKLELPEDFTWGKSYKPMKYVMLLVLITGCFGVGTFGVTTLAWLRGLPGRWRAWRAGDSPFWDALSEDDSPLERRARERAALLARGEWWARGIALIEGARARGLVWGGVFVLFGALSLWSYLPRATFHFSQRHIFETYLTSRDSGEELYRYQSPQKKGSFYLRDVPSVSASGEFMKMLDAPERMYAVVPRDRLAQVNYDSRRMREKKNVHVLDARSGDLVLLSNALEEGERDQNFIAESILDGGAGIPEEIEHLVRFEDKSGQQVHATFDGQLELLGYSLGREGAHRGAGVPVYAWGEEIEVTLYFKVLARVPTSQKIFMHIDTSGNRLHGDHYPGGGEFHTNYWLPGDIVKDTHAVSVANYTTAGRYAIGIGFYRGKDRMKVEPATAHKGNRLKLGEIAIKGL